MSEAATLTTETAVPPIQLAAALYGSAIFDLADRTRIRVAGADRLRWLNGMVSNAIQTLPEGHGNYNFILNAQGKIQGDAYIYRRAEDLILDTDRPQAARLLAHLDHFIIMDDVELHPLDGSTTGIGLMGPNSTDILDRLALNASALGPLQFTETSLNGARITLVHAYSVSIPRYELWFRPEDSARIHQAFAETSALHVDPATVEAVRILQGIPRYGTDITDRHLAQETTQTRALNFTKGCYLGQEIVERIRSRATVHRNLRQFSLEGTATAVPADLRVVRDPAAVDSSAGDSSVVGQLTSVAPIQLPGFTQNFGIGFIRTEAVERAIALQASIEYDGGVATVLDHPPTLPQP